MQCSSSIIISVLKIHLAIYTIAIILCIQDLTMIIELD